MFERFGCFAHGDETVIRKDEGQGEDCKTEDGRVNEQREDGKRDEGKTKQEIHESEV